MRAYTKGKHEMGKRFAIVIGVAAAGVMALGAQAATSSTGQPVDRTPPDLQLSGKKKQELGNAVKVKASCGDDACFAIGTGWLERHPAQGGVPGELKLASGADLGPGETTTLKLKLEKKTRQKAGNALDNGKTVQAHVIIDATDAAGNEAHAKRTITLVK
jgi:hypothetical protein